jgi:HSP20 family molecular chaperone IbpA
MTQVSVRNLDGGKSADSNLLNSLNGMIQAIQNRAFQLSETGTSGSSSNLGGSSNTAMDNWLQAERELYMVPQSELSETDREVRIQVSVAGIDSKDLEVSATGSSIIVTSASSRQTGNMSTSGSSGSGGSGSAGSGSGGSGSSGSGSGGGSTSTSGNVRFSDFGSKPLFRRFDLGSSGMSQATATLDNGLLTITITKSADSRSTAARA